MATKGRKKKKEVYLYKQDEPTKYIDYADESITTKALIWEHEDIDKNTNVYKYPLSKDSALQYWESQYKSKKDQYTKSILTRIKNNSASRDTELHIYDKYPMYTKLIDQLLYSTSTICTDKNYSKRSGSQYASALAAVMKYFTTFFKDVYSIEDFDISKQMIFVNELSKSANKYFHEKQKSISRNIVLHTLSTSDLPPDLLKKRISRSSHSSAKTRLDYPQEVALQLLAAAFSEIKIIKEKFYEYTNWKKEYDNKLFDSPENLAKAYLNIPENVLNKNNQFSITAYKKTYDDLCFDMHGFKLSTLTKKDLETLSEKGHNIDDLNSPFTMAWFLDDINCNYPFPNNKNISSTDSYAPMSEYTRWNTRLPFAGYLRNRGNRRGSNFIPVYQDIFSRKYPTASEITPFIIIWMLQTGCNPEALVNMKRKESVEPYNNIEKNSLFGDAIVLRSFKNRGTKDWYWFVLDPHEKNGLYDHFNFLKSYLSLLWEHDRPLKKKNKHNFPFWVYYSPFKANKITYLTSQNLQSLLLNFLNKYHILLPDGSVMKHIEPSRLRNTFITMSELNGASLEEIQEWIRHENLDTRFRYYDDSPEQRSRNFRTIHAIQEDIIENARNFQGQIGEGTLQENISNKNVDSTYLCGCSDTKNPTFEGARNIPSDHICIDWDMCLFCPNSRIFLEHLPRICARILQYETYQKKMTPDEWENNFGTKHTVAKDALKKWIIDGGSQKDIDEAWLISKSGSIILPTIFPTGSIQISFKGKIHVA